VNNAPWVPTECETCEEKALQETQRCKHCFEVELMVDALRSAIDKPNV